MLSLGTNVALKAATSGYLDIEELKGIKDSFSRDESAMISAALENKLSNYKEDVKVIDSFVAELEALVGTKLDLNMD